MANTFADFVYMKQLCIKRCLSVIAISIILLQLTGCCKKKAKVTTAPVNPIVKNTQNNHEAVSEESDKLLKKTGLNYSVDSVARKIAPMKPSGMGNFETQYLKGVNLLEQEKLAEALSVFKEILERYPEGEEASVAALCVAEIYFRMKNNEGALNLYKEIIKKYPGTQAAMNAAEGIKYLETFERYEKNYVAPEQEDRRRRGR